MDEDINTDATTIFHMLKKAKESLNTFNKRYNKANSNFKRLKIYLR